MGVMGPRHWAERPDALLCRRWTEGFKGAKRDDVHRQARATFEAMASSNENERVDLALELHVAQRPLIAALREVGIDVENVYELVNAQRSDRRAIPVLVEHLRRDYPPRVLEGVARALATRHAAPYWPDLVEAYKNWTDVGAQQGAACAVAAAAAQEHVDALLMLIADESLGASRVLLLPALVRLGDDVVVEPFLERLTQHPVIGREAASTLRKRKRRRVT